MVFSFVTASEGYDSTHPILLLLKKMSYGTTLHPYPMVFLESGQENYGTVTYQNGEKKAAKNISDTKEIFLALPCDISQKVATHFFAKAAFRKWLRQYPWIFECFFQLKFNFYEPSLHLLIVKKSLTNTKVIFFAAGLLVDRNEVKR